MTAMTLMTRIDIRLQPKKDLLALDAGQGIHINTFINNNTHPIFACTSVQLHTI